jgi:hypothetical protein
VSDDADDVVGQLRSEGFEPIEELTGEIEFALVWPDAHRRAVPDTRYELEDPDFAIPGLTDGTLFVVRSPWSSISNGEAVDLLQRWIRRNRTKDSAAASQRVDQDRELSLAKRFLDQDERWVRAYREGHIRPMRDSHPG